MHTWREFGLISCQASVFTPSMPALRPRDRLELLTAWSDRFDGEPSEMPPLQGLPPEIPLTLLQSRDGQYRCEFAPARVNLFWRHVDDDHPVLELAEFLEFAANLFGRYVQVVPAPIARMAAVSLRTVEDEAPGRSLASHFCKEQWLQAPFDRPEGFELHAHKVYSLDGRWTVNSWVKNRTGTITVGERRRNVLIVEQDINTTAPDAGETSRDLTTSLGDFFRIAPREMADVLGLYYPETP